MKPNTYRTVGAVCSMIIVALAVLGLIYAAGGKLATIETEITGVKHRLTNIESILKEAIHGRPSAVSTGFRHGIARVADVGHSESVIGLPSTAASDDTDGALVLYGDGPEAD